MDGSKRLLMIMIMRRLAATVLALALDALASTQQVMSTTSDTWTAQLGREWNVLGPFPIRAREQHLLSPAFPLGGATLHAFF